KPLGPDFKKLNPVTGFKNLFNITKVFDLAKNILKMLVLGIVGFLVFSEFLPKLLVLGGTENVFAMLGILGELIMKFILVVTIAFLILGVGDWLFQRWKFMKDQKMSFKEMKDEYKN